MEVKGEICYFTKKVINEFGKSQNIKVDKVELTDYFQRIKAVYWYEKLAEQGNATAQFNLGNSYKKGEGVEKDGKRAVELLENKSSSLLPPPPGKTFLYAWRASKTVGEMLMPPKRIRSSFRSVRSTIPSKKSRRA